MASILCYDKTMILLNTLRIALIIQAGFFIWAALKKSDQVTDLSYGLSFVILAIYLASLKSVHNLQALIITMVVLWGLRLAGYLFYRILTIKKDRRFDGIRENFWQFAKFWLLQGISVWIIMLPAIMAMEIDINKIVPAGIEPWETFRPAPLPVFIVFGLLVWLTGWILETLADWQKFQFKIKLENKNSWISSGVWSWSRHPNYFGEMLCWWGIFLCIAPGLTGWQWLVVLGPVYITSLLLFGTGLPTLEKHYNQIYATNVEYLKYKAKTSILIPWPPKT